MEGFDHNLIKLDEEFKQGLQNIRGYLVNLTSPQAARFCGEWLQKLRDSSDERELRNVLLQRLISQVQTRKLEYPFDRSPTDKPLYKLYEDGDASSWSTEDLASSTKGTITTSGETMEYYIKERIEDTCRTTNETWYELPVHGQNVPKDSSPKPFKNQDIKFANIISENSYQTKKEDTLEREYQIREGAAISTIKTDRNKSKDQSKKNLDVEELTICLGDYKSLLSDYKRVINENIKELSNRLETVVESNQIQKSDLKTLQTSLHDSWAAKLQGLESDLLTEISKLECQLAADRSKYEGKIEHLKQVILEKDDKINSLDAKIKQHATSIKEKMNSVRDEISQVAKENDFQYKKKYSFLKKQLINLDNINRELTKQHEKNISLTIKDYETKLKSAKLVGSEESMTGFEDKIKQLENNYKRIFQDYKKKLDENKSKESKRIHFSGLDTINK